ncbi:PTS sugar transporter subunit IIA [Clostridium gasigenes]|uniref:PTS sugar transporter subunit IIA n=1 Tax=Clostridium gasigenes TaxID=94869 RepID=A0A7X0SBA1_9CLOT|nr:PTS sugar transporter subunit IIA [Clostridium gasigenes]MBB6714493.1 PTS sugar transporter subunit IIA [Clostridium gasigenes]
MYKVLIVSHSTLCKGLNEAVTMIMGAELEVDYLGLDEDGVEIFHQRLKEKINNLKKESDEILILADLFGGTPFNRSLIESTQNNKIKIITGVNLPMVIEAVINKHRNIEEVVAEIIQGSKDSIKEGVILINNTLEDE